MSPITVGALGIGLLLVLIALQMPIGFAMALTGFLGSMFLAGGQVATAVLGIVPYSTNASYTFSAVPTFILMGELAFVSGISGDLFTAAYHWLGKIRGGMAITTISACAVFSAACGSSVATAATMGTLALPEMKKLNYSSRFATGTVAAGGTLGILIPPSIPLIVYGTLTEQSVGKLFMAGIIPGIMLAIMYAIIAFVWASRSPTAAPRANLSFTLKQKITSTGKVWGMMVLIFFVLGGIYLGWFTPTESGALGAFGAFLLTIAKKQLTRRNLLTALKDTARTTSMIFIILTGAMVFQHFLAVTRLPMTLANFLGGLALSKYVILAAIIVLLVVLGCFLDSLAMLLLTLPIIYPIITKFGFDPIWFGVIMVIMIETGLVTPPVGINVFVVAGVAKDVPLQEIFRGIAPYLFALAAIVLVVIIFPQVALLLPNMMNR